MLQEIDYPFALLVINIGVFLCLTLGPFLFFSKSSKNNANVFLGGLTVIFFLFFSQGALYRYHLMDNFPYFIGFGNNALFLLGPFAYFYIRASTQKGFRLRLIDGLHFLPFIINFGMDIPRYLKTDEERIAEYIYFINNGNLPNQGDWELLLKSLHGVVYFAVSVYLIMQYRKNLSNETSAVDTTFHRWMLLFVILLALPVSSIFFYINTDYNRIFIPLQLLSFFLLLLAIYIATLIKPQLFQTFPHQMLLPESSEVQKQKYERSNLQEAQKEQYLTKLKTFVELEKPYQSPDFTIAQLSEKVKIPSHYLSQVINEKLGVSFLDFINSYRVKAAQEMLTNPKFSHYTIMSIAYDAGFNAKSTFYSVFKKQTGMTPSQYRKKMVGSVQ